MTDDDIAEAERLIALPGGPGSGRVRYGAAMRLWAAGRLSATDVESYRIASPHDTAHAPLTPAAAIDRWWMRRPPTSPPSPAPASPRCARALPSGAAPPPRHPAPQRRRGPLAA